MKSIAMSVQGIQTYGAAHLQTLERLSPKVTDGEEDELLRVPG